MSKLVLISCVSKKLDHKSRAKDLYVSPYFKYNLKYAKSLKPDKIFILSAKYGLLKLDDEIEPYDMSLNKMSSKNINEWAENVLSKLRKVSVLEKDKFIILAGNNYRKYLLTHITHYHIPMKGLGIGKQLKWLKEKTGSSNNCHTIHQWFNGMPKHSFPFNDNDVPVNGIYILFEKGEFAHSTARIVRIGTHTGKNQLLLRIKQHFINENKDRSIFRKNIGRAMLQKNNDPFLNQWELDLTTRKAKEKYSETVDFNKQNEVEKKVSRYIQSKFSFIVFQVDDKEKRHELESSIISTVSLCDDCKPSKEWLGLYSPKRKIRKSGLWLVNELWKAPLSDEGINELKHILNFKY